MRSVRTILPDTARVLRTARYLKARQVINRITRRLPCRLRLDESAPSLRGPSGGWRSCSGRPALLAAADRFGFMRQEAGLASASIWNDGSMPKLWLYHLHYFDDLLAERAHEREAWHRNLVSRWISENPAPGGTGWEPYPLSRRIVNWVCWSLSGFRLPDGAEASLAAQSRRLRATLEYHLFGNHLFANAKALVFAGAFFEGVEADEWLRRGLAILETQIPEQVLRDGGHFERSPMYHAVILEDMIDLLQLSQTYPEILADARARQRWDGRAGAMLAWLHAMTHPDGEIAFFNDATFGQARRPANLAAYAAEFGVVASGEPPALLHLPESGYVRLSAGPWCAFFDAAMVGPDYIPGHAHADTLSVELSLDGQRLVTNGGTSTYAPGEAREWERSTAAHATVEVDGQNSSEVWASFRVGRRAHPMGVSVAQAGGRLTAAASHDGYRFLPGRPLHRREIFIDHDRLSIRDTIRGGGTHAIIGRFPLHPSVAEVAADRTGWRIRLAAGRIMTISVEGPVKCAVENGFFGSEFGVRQERKVLVWRTALPLPLSIVTDFRL